MKRVENLCVNCATGSYPCLGNSCPNRRVTIYICDECKDESETLYVYDDKELCINCIKQRLEVVK